MTCKGEFLFRTLEVGREEGDTFFKKIFATFYEAEISCDGIISYDWLEKNQIAIFPHRGCLMQEGKKNSHWLFGADIEGVMGEWDEIEIPSRGEVTSKKRKIFLLTKFLCGNWKKC